MSSKWAIIGASSLFLMLAACGLGDRVVIDDINYPTHAAALAAYQRRQAEDVSAVAPQTDPIKGSLRVVIADRDRLRPYVRQLYTTGNQGPGDDLLELELSLQQILLRDAAMAITAGRAFETARIDEQNDVQQPDFAGADYVLWLQVRTLEPDSPGVWAARWQLRRAGAPGVREPIFDAGVRQGSPRYASFVTSVRDAVFALGGATVAGKATPSH